MTTKYSIVIPLKDEEENIQNLVGEIAPVMHSLKETWELICIDDGSKDKTLSLLKELAKEERTLRILSFEKNAGQSSAFDAGFKAARGEYVITLDGDGQNDPADIPKLIEYAPNYEMVIGWRVNRKDPFVKKITSFFANRIRGKLCEDSVKDTGCSLKVYKKNALNQIKMFNGMHRFLPALFKIEGYSIKEVPVNHRPRQGGTTKYSFFNRSFNTIADLFAVRWMRKRKLNYIIKEDV